MTALAKLTTTLGGRYTRRSSRMTVAMKRAHMKREELIQESIEDAQLNAIADERADGPFVKVSLDDL